MKFVDVKNDIAFRRIFGNENKTEIVISFLNAVLKFEGDRRIQEVTFLNPFQLPRIAGEKASILDIHAKDQSGRQFVIEMQIAEQEGFDKRVQYYASREYSTQIDRGEDYPNLRPTYFVGILDFDYFSGADYLSNHLILDKKTLEHKLCDITFTFIELGKFDLKEHELKTLVEKWVFFIKNAKNLEVIPKNTDDPGLQSAYEGANRHNWKKEELVVYEDYAIAAQDVKGRMSLAHKKGVDEGIESVAVRCLNQGKSVEATAEITGLSQEQVREIAEKI